MPAVVYTLVRVAVSLVAFAVHEFCTGRDSVMESANPEIFAREAIYSKDAQNSALTSEPPPPLQGLLDRSRLR